MSDQMKVTSKMSCSTAPNDMLAWGRNEGWGGG